MITKSWIYDDKTIIPRIQKIILEDVRLALDTKISNTSFIIDTDLELVVDSLTRDIIARFTALLRGKITYKKDVEEVPINSWEHFKFDFFPKLLLKWFPVKTRLIEKSGQQIFNICPHIDNSSCVILTYALEKEETNKNSNKKE